MCDLLAVDPAVLDESTAFDELGMSSTMCVRLLAMLETRLDVVIDIGELYRLADLRGVTAVVSEALARRSAK